MLFKSINPYNNETIGSYQEISDEEIVENILRSQNAFESWKNVPVAQRAALIAKAGQILEVNCDEYARMITLEMGKPISEARSEVKKCAWVCEYYAKHSSAFLANEIIQTDASRSFVRNDPMGSVLAVMPWNFPFWQVFRYAAPTLTAGNTGLLKHASNTYGCATLIEEVFQKAGFPEHVFQNLIIHHDKTESVIAHDAVQAVTLTGSERAGTSVGELAGRYLKKSVLELGGSNSFIVLKDANIDQSVGLAVTARMMNAGQSCIAAKRFLVAKEIYDEFLSGFVDAVRKLKAGDPLKEDTTIGPLAKKDLADDLQNQMQKSIDQGAELLHGGKQDGCYHEPTVLSGVKPGMPAFDEETFGPLAAFTKFVDESEAVVLSEKSRYGLGVTVCTSDTDKALSLAGKFSDGACFINELVKSDPRLPFGGTKRSGYGRELAKDGILEFVNRKTVYVK